MESFFEKVRLILAVEADLKPNTASRVRNRGKRGWLNVAVIQPSTDSVHSLAEGTSRFYVDLHEEWVIERHIMLLASRGSVRNLSSGGRRVSQSLACGGIYSDGRSILADPWRVAADV